MIARRHRYNALQAVLMMCGLASTVGGCLVSTEPAKGDKGDKGDQGESGAADPALLKTIAEMSAKMVVLEERLAVLEKAASDPDCPPGYTYSPLPSAPAVVRCTLGAPGEEHDEVVRVGSGATAFWIDRFEASVWADPEATAGASTGVPYGVTSADFPLTFPANGQVIDEAHLLFARSRKGVNPTSWVSWFQAQLACAASGKRLPTNEEWQLAAMGTPDPPQPSDGANGLCVTKGSLRTTGAPNADVNCASAWGAEDMVGNYGEWTAAWYATVSSGGLAGYDALWGPGYGDDRIRNIDTSVYNMSDNVNTNLPAVAVRGGGDGVSCGVFSMSLGDAPTVAIKVYA